VYGEGDVISPGNDREHPKVYVGFFSHAAYRHKCDATQGCSTTDGGAGSQLEYRSSDWYSLPVVEDLKHWATLDSKLFYSNAPGVCCTFI
jgi:hypothetical protein